MTDERSKTAHQRSLAAEILWAYKEDVLSRWTDKVSLLAREKGIGEALDDPIVRKDLNEMLNLVVKRLQGEALEADMTAFYHLVLESRRYDMHLADIAYVLLELKSVGKQTIFEHVEDELQAFQVSRLLDDAVEGMLRKSANLYELTSEADHQVAQQRLQEVFDAWELEAALADTQTPGDVCRVATERLRGMWRLLGCRWRLYGPSDEQPRDFVEGDLLPVPVVKEQRQYLTEGELATGGVVSVLECVRRRREPYVCEDVREDERVMDRSQLVEAGIHSFVCQPLAVRGQVIGVLLMLGGAESDLRETDARRLGDLANVSALSLERAGHLELSHKRLSEGEVIARIGRSLLELPTRDALLQGVVDALQEFRGYFDVSLFWLDAESDECELVAEAGRGRLYRPEGYRQKSGEGFIGVCAREGSTIRATDLESDQRRVVAFEEEYRARTELVVPVKRGDEVLGVIHFLSDREDDFPESDVAALEHVAPHIGVALQNARLIEQRDRDRFEIERAHRQLANIIRSAAVGMTSADPRGVYTHWSPSCEAMLGYKADEVVGQKTAVDFAAEPYDLRALLEDCLREGRVVRERSWLRKDGTPRIIRETRVTMEDERGRHIGFTSYLVDVTEQKKAEEQLRRERDTLQLVVGAMGAGLALFDRDLKLQWANSTLMAWFDLSPADMGKKCHQVYGCGRTEEEDCPLVTAAMDGQARSRLQEHTDSSGVWHCYEQVFTPIDYGGTRLIVLSLDITEERRRTEEVRLIGKLTEKVATSLDLDRVLHLVLTCVTAGHAIGFNRAFVFLLDEEGDYLEGTTAVGPVSPDAAGRIWTDLGRRAPTIDDLLDSASPSRGDRELTERVRLLRVSMHDPEDALISTLKSGTSAHIGDARSDRNLSPRIRDTLELEEYVCVPLIVRDQPLGVMLADNKFSRAPMDRYQVELLEMFSRQASLAIANARAYEQIRAQLEELRRTRDKLIEAERMASVGRMAGHLAHEIRNPLTSIGGFAASIARRYPEDSITHRNANIIYEEVRRLERTLVDVLDYTRPLRPRRAPVSIDQVVKDTVGQFGPQLAESNIRVRVSLAGDLPDVLADGQMIKQVVLNLIKNAIEAMEGKEGGTLSIETSREGEKVIVTVADTGVGMPEEVVTSLFSPFFTTKVTGVGLGLSVSQRIVREHGGDLTVQSELGSGSRFIVSLAAQGNRKGER